MVISLIHPSRGRAQNAHDIARVWLNRIGPVKWEYILSIDADDHCGYDLLKGAQNMRCLVSENRSAVDAINNAAKISNGDLFVVMSDDMDCPENWGTFILKYTQWKTDFIIKTQDGVQPWIVTLPILDRVYYNRFGYIYHPDYQHMFCDTELTCVADLTGRKLTSNILFKHNHYSVTKEPRDAVSIKADSTWDQGEKLFLERYKRNFDLPPDQIKGKILDSGMINWLQRKAR